MKSIHSVGGEIGKVSVFDGPNLLIANGNTISVITMRTTPPSLFTTLPPPISGMQPIIALALHPTAKGAIFGATRDGMIFLWDWINQTLLERWRMGVECLLSLLPSKDSNNIFIVTQKINSSKKTIATVFKLPLSDLSSENPFKRVLEAQQPAFPLSSGELEQGNTIYAPFALGKGDLLAYLSLDPKLGSVICFKYLSPSTVSAPERIVIGFSPASIPTILHFPLTLEDAAQQQQQQTATTTNLFYSNKRGQIMSLLTGKKVLHWHSRSPHSLLSISSSDMTSLFSGGEEGCLLRWRIPTTTTTTTTLPAERPDFIPHIQSPIVNISYGQNALALLLQSGSILFVDGGTMKVVSSFVSLSLPPKMLDKQKALTSPPPTAILTQHPKLRNVIWANGGRQISKLESLSLPIHQSQHLKAFDVAEENVISRGRSPGHPRTSCLEAVGSSPDGRYVATCTSLKSNTPSSTTSTTLKIWRQQSKDGGKADWDCQVSFEDCHLIKEIIFSPITKPFYYFLSVGSEDRKVCMWSSRAKRVAAIQRSCKNYGGDGSDEIEILERVAWIQERSISFLKKKPLCSVFTKDGNQFLVAFEGGIIRFYDCFSAPATPAVKELSVILTTKGEEITSISFLGNGKLLITTSEKIIIVRDGDAENIIQCPAISILKGIPLLNKEDGFILTTKEGLIIAMNDEFQLLQGHYKHSDGIEDSILSKDGKIVIRDVKGRINWIVMDADADGDDDASKMSLLKEEIFKEIINLQKEHQSITEDIRPQELTSKVVLKITPDFLKNQQKSLLSSIANYLLPLPSESISHFLRGL